MLRKMLLTGAVCMVGSGTSGQILFAVFISFFHTCLTLKSGPFVESSEDNMQLISAMSLIFTLLFGFAMYNDTDGVYSGPFIDWMLVVLSVLTVIVIFVIMLMQMPAVQILLAKLGSTSKKESSSTAATTKNDGSVKVLPVENSDNAADNVDNVDNANNADNADSSDSGNLTNQEKESIKGWED